MASESSIPLPPHIETFDDEPQPSASGSRQDEAGPRTNTLGRPCSGDHLPRYPVSLYTPSRFALINNKASVEARYTQMMHHLSHIVGRNPTQAEAEGIAEHVSAYCRIASRGYQIGLVTGLLYCSVARPTLGYRINHSRWRKLGYGPHHFACYYAWRTAKCTAGGLLLGSVFGAVYYGVREIPRVKGDERLGEFWKAISGNPEAKSHS